MGGEALETFLELEQEHAEHADGRRDPVVLALHQPADDKCRERGNLSRQARGRLATEIVVVREKHEAADDCEPHCPSGQLRRRESASA